MRPTSHRPLRPTLVLAALVAVAVVVVAASSPMRRGAPAGGPPPGGRDAPAVIGLLDGVRRTTAGVEVSGWATDGTDSQLTIRLLVGGRRVATTTTGDDRFDVVAAHGPTASGAGFHAVVGVAAPAAAVCADAVAGGGVTRLGCLPLDAAAAAADTRALDRLTGELVAQAETTLGFQIAIAVVPLDTDVVAGHDIDRPFISASAAKAWWTAAALRRGAVAEAAVAAPAVFEVSSDGAAGTMIDLGGGIDDVNDFTLALGMEHTGAMKWNAGRERIASRPDGPLGKSNFTTASDAARFGALLATGRVLSPPSTALLLDWMRTSPRTDSDPNSQYFGVASTIPQGLPPTERAAVAHKAGWLYPGEYPAVPAHLLDVGIVFPADGRAYAIALLASGPHDTVRYGRLVQFFEHASCRIHLAMAADPGWACDSW